MSSNTTRHARRGAKEVRNAARHVRQTASHEANNVLHSMRRMGDNVTGAVRDGLENVRDTASDYIDEGVSRAYELEKRVEARVQSRPMTSLMAAIGFGFLIGFFCSRRS